MANIAKEIILAALKKRPTDVEQFNELKRRILRADGQGANFPTTAELLKAYHKLKKKNKELEALLTKRAVRTLSGVSIITVLTKPHSCPGACIYCPDEKSMPKSYLADEPAAARALALRFDPYEQVRVRIDVLKKNGHPTDKIELIVKGGTWNAYPLSYQYWFILRCFIACNAKNQKSPPKADPPLAEKIKISELKIRLTDEQKNNEIANHRIVGLTLETRPDHVTEKNVLAMRELGCTRVELGVQTTDDKILKLIKRGHGTAETIRATALLKNYGFKVDYHLMPQLPGATPAKDAKMLAEIFSNSAYRPDMIKIYPCTAVKNSPLYRWVKSGKYKPYSDKKLVELIINFKTRVPRYVRISRVIRDIPGHHIVAGNRMTNLRQVIQAEMARRGLRCNCLRCREVGHQDQFTVHSSQFTPKLFIDKYEANGGTEYFLSYEDTKRAVVYAFCRLRICPNNRRPVNCELRTANYPAFLRELHTYGQSLAVGTKNTRDSQHRGLGKKLLVEVEKICKKNKIPELAVISGAGVRDYYRKLGYNLINTYMIKKI
ncbi:MAG: tRNA uridine(34) 5-carboxymethylaminomethyl modification radical SAM/GNAT enzyme Elp3 [Patescibacteria group bacterium]|nr:tRNA uridine(34) 5-carboxymethylaminomethyl modification radical SAM/GNAT enzyme Elp3 [Patescibacteria group bacterium]